MCLCERETWYPFTSIITLHQQLYYNSILISYLLTILGHVKVAHFRVVGYTVCARLFQAKNSIHVTLFLYLSNI